MTDKFVEPALGNSGGWSPARVAEIPNMKLQIIEGFRSGQFASEIADALGITTALIRTWKAQDKEFEEACADAEDAYTDGTEKEAVRRARFGVLEPVISQGKVVLDPENQGKPLMVRKYSDSLLMFILKGRRRAVYGDRSKVEAEVKLDVTGAKSELARKLGALAEPAEAPGLPDDADG